MWDNVNIFAYVLEGLMIETRWMDEDDGRFMRENWGLEEQMGVMDLEIENSVCGIKLEIDKIRELVTKIFSR